MTDPNLIYEKEDFSYCDGCVNQMTGECDDCDNGDKHQEGGT
jgi:hypothetical protein